MPSEQQTVPRRCVARRYWRHLLIIIVVLWAIAWGFLAFVAPGLVRDGAARWAQGMGRELKINTVTVRPWSMSLTLDGVRLTDRDKSTLFAAERVELNAMPLSLLLGHWRAEALKLTRPEVDLVRARDGSWNWARFMKDASGPGPARSSPPKIFIDWLYLDQGRLVFRDHVASTHQTFDWQRINLNLHDLSTAAGEGGYVLSASLSDKTQLKWRGLIGLEPLFSAGRISISRLPIASIWDYLHPFVQLASPAGDLSLDLNYVFDLKGKQARLTLSTLYGRIEGLNVRSPDGRSHLALEQLAVEDGIVDLRKRLLFFKRVRLNGGQVEALRDPTGQVNWLAALPAATTPSTPSREPGWKIQVNDLRLSQWQWQLEDQSRKQPLMLQGTLPSLALGLQIGQHGELNIDRVNAKLTNFTLAVRGQPALLSVGAVGLANASLAGHEIQGGALTLQQPALTLMRDAAGHLNVATLLSTQASRSAAVDRAVKATPSPWKITLPRLIMDDGRLVWRDRALARPVELVLAPISGSLSPDKEDGRFDTALTVHSGRGQLSFTGQLDPAGPQLQGQVAVRAMPLAPLSGYLLSKTLLSMPQGSLSAKLDLRYAPTSWQLLGQAGIEGLRVLEPGASKPLLGWRALTLSGLKVSAKPLKVSIREVSLNQPALRLMLDQQRVSNLSRLFAGPEGAKPAPVELAPAPKLPLAFDVRMIRVRNGDVDFADFGMKPSFATHVHGLSGTVTGLSSQVGKRGAIALNGLVDQAGDVRVRGALSPLALTESADIQLMFRNIALSSLNTYSENIAGWQIQDGRLSMELAYLLNHRKLQGDNRIVIDSIKLGPQVEKPGVSRLPLSLAVAVLEDSRGRIDLHLPVSGDLDDPKFNYSGLIWQAFVNVIHKVATAPFRALGALLGLDGFDEVRFVAGEAALAPPERQKLSQLAQMMQDRPQMRLNIIGTWDPVADRRELARARVDRAILKAAGVVMLSDEPLPAIDVQDTDTQQAIKAMFAERIGRLKLLARRVSGGSGPAFYQALRSEAIAAEKVSDADLLALANARVEGAQQYLTQTYPTLATRVAIGRAKAAQASADGVPLEIDLTAR